MQYLNICAPLLSKTQFRDKLLRFVQYATIHSQDHIVKGSTFNAYTQIRRARKWLRFLAWIEIITNFRKNYKQCSKIKDWHLLGLKLLTLFEGLSQILFYLFDHQVILSEIGLLSTSKTSIYRHRSFRMYLLQNIFGALKCLFQMLIFVQRGSLTLKLEEGTTKKGEKEMRAKSIQFLRNILDVIVACYYLNKPREMARRVGIMGMLTSLIGLSRSLQWI